MKRIILMLTAILPLMVVAQSVMVTRSLEMLPNSQAVVQFNNIFGNWENREVDDSFPYVVIQMNLTGDAKAVSMAKMKIGLEVGTMFQVTATDKNQQNKILFLVPRGVRNIYVVCGDGCEKQLLHSGTLVENKVYECTVEYVREPLPVGEHDDEIDDVRRQIAEQNEQMEEIKRQNEQLQRLLKGVAPRDSLPEVAQEKTDDVVRIEVNGAVFNMIKVAGGEIVLKRTSAGSGEDTVKRVTVNDFYIGETEVTQALWVAVMGGNPSHSKEMPKPVENVSWNDCMTFIRKLNELTGRTFALPSELQWEYAARGGAMGKGYGFSGSDNLDDVGWNWNNSGDEKREGDWEEEEQLNSARCRTHAVGQKLPNELGLYDMSGNVWEWCRDSYENTDGILESLFSDYSSDPFHGAKGGGFTSISKYCSPSCKMVRRCETRLESLGLRLILLL